MNTFDSNLIVDENQINATLQNSLKPDNSKVRDILQKSLSMQGLSYAEVATLSAITDPDLIQELYLCAKKVKESIYGKRIVIFAPLYVANYCQNECSYCAFRASNRELTRRFLSQEEIAKETELLVKQGHKRIVLLAGESYPKNDFQYILDAIATVYKVKSKAGEIRRINVNLAPLALEDFKRLHAAQIGTYQLFQETYNRTTYKKVHLGGKKTDYDWRITAFDRAMQAEIDDVGLGVLFGLHDWKFEILALMQHAAYLQKNFGVGPHTISVPRIEPAIGSEVSLKPLAPVSDEDFCKLIAILRLAVPYTGIIMSTRETPEMRRLTLALGVSQISAGSRTDPGGYQDTSKEASQFSLGDHRTLDEVVEDLATLGYIPSFCTACYRMGRTGEDFMCLAKPGKIKDICAPNALATFAEYLIDYATPATKAVGEKLIQNELNNLTPLQKQTAEKLLAKVRAGQRDIYI